MNVNDIRQRIVEISHDEAAPDTDLSARALKWLNSAYHELMDELMPHLGRYLTTQENTTATTTGVVTLTGTPARIIRVVDKTNGRVLTETDKASLLDNDPAETATGSPQFFVVSGNLLTLHPKSAVSVSVLYQQAVVDLAEGGAESSIILPPQYHVALVWGGLVWAAIQERGFSTQTDLVLFQRKWDEAKEKVKLSLISRPSAVLRVAPYDIT